MHYDFTTDAPPVLNITLAAVEGTIEVHGDARPNTVTIDIPDEAADQIKVERRRHAVSIRSQQRPWRSTRAGVITVHTDPRTALAARVGAGALITTGTLRVARVTTGAGDITLGHITESLVAKSGAGRIEAESVGGSSVLSSGAGSIHAGHLRGSARLATGVGELEIDEANGTTELKSGAGAVRVGLATGDLVAKSGWGGLDIGRFSGSKLTVRANTGDIVVGVPQGRAVWRDISTAYGALRSELPTRGEPAPGEPHSEIRAYLHRGDITLVER